MTQATGLNGMGEGHGTLVLLFDLNWDRVIFPAGIALALIAGSYLASFAPL
ncbi:hypothetical protein [Rhodovulum viride]|uniref:hypothetical protein n=1 Tax=Rhodovulum viride TaxID=1231134 RepID=UPI0015EBB3BE|nr:hypothetical protein [Rhodovulum viride]